ncbi:hypothetical protein M0802_001636 [Mischocyttarus mexicanus]|nr:hypothetical protein M0802_001636 [Mischocyttarus mexicanus]
MITFTSIIWSESSWLYIWLPPHITWKDISPYYEQNINNRVLLFFLLTSLLLFVVKYIFQSYLFVFFGEWLGIKNKRTQKVPQIEVLEKAYTSKKIDHKQILALARQLDCSERKIERWLRLKKFQDNLSVIKKFSESGWRCFYYTCMTTYGFIILWNKPWFWDINQCYYNFPYHSISNDIWLYWLISIAFYSVSTITHFFETKRKDFWQVFIHHIITIAIILLIWIVNLLRVGSLILLVHDIPEVFLELAKMGIYVKDRKFSNFMFIIFTISWICTRDGIFPFVIIYSTIFEAPKHIPMFPAFYVLNVLYCLLFLLHIFWTYFIIKLVYISFYRGNVINDIRSDNEDVFDESENKINLSVNDKTKHIKRNIKKEMY